MKIIKTVKRLKYPLWEDGNYIEIGGKFIFNDSIVQCVKGSGACSAHNNSRHTCFFYDTHNRYGCANRHRCIDRPDFITVSFVKVES